MVVLKTNPSIQKLIKLFSDALLDFLTSSFSKNFNFMSFDLKIVRVFLYFLFYSPFFLEYAKIFRISSEKMKKIRTDRWKKTFV